MVLRDMPDRFARFRDMRDGWKAPKPPEAACLHQRLTRLSRQSARAKHEKRQDGQKHERARNADARTAIHEHGKARRVQGGCGRRRCARASASGVSAPRAGSLRQVCVHLEKTATLSDSPRPLPLAKSKPSGIVAPSMASLGRLEYLYMGTSDFARDLAWWRDVMRGEVVWNFDAFGAHVAALRVWDDGPLLLLADHRPSPSLLPVHGVADLDAARKDLESRGWRAHGEPFGIPDGTCVLYKDPSGNEFALYGIERPHALEASFADPRNPRAVRD